MYSFDVFDTCVTRVFAHPRDLFYELGLQHSQSARTAGDARSFAARFQALRIRAEKRARRITRPSCAVNLHNIYSCMRRMDQLTGNVDDLVASEVALERRSIYPISGVVSRIEALRARGHRVIFISDMYLPAPVLRSILIDCGVMRAEEKLYVCCDIGASKDDGKLFERVLAEEHLLPSQLSHFGDNFHADVLMARRAGIMATQFTRATLTPAEAKLAGKKLPRNAGNSYLAAFARRLRLQRASIADPVGDIIRGVIVPFLIVYVRWVLKDAEKRDIRKLFFVARDGEILLSIARVLQDQGSCVQLRYLYGSRQAWIPASICTSDVDLWRLLLLTGRPDSRYDITARTGVHDEDNEFIRRAHQISQEKWCESLSSIDCKQFVDALLANEACVRIIAASARSAQESAVAYFRQEGLFDKEKWALVDAGWSLNAQAALGRLLKSADPSYRKPQGYYVALARDRVKESVAGPAHPFIDHEGSIFSRRRVTFEHSFLASTHTSTKGYEWQDGKMVPILGNEVRGVAELDYARSLHETAISAARLVASDRNVASFFDRYASQIVGCAERLLQNPLPTEARALATLGTIADMRHEESFVNPLCRPLQLKDVSAIARTAISPTKECTLPSFTWLEGSMSLSPWYVRAPLALILAGDAWRSRQ